MAKAEQKLNNLMKQDIIAKFPDDEPRTWISPPVVAQSLMGIIFDSVLI